ncbi:MAG: hypothetical protein ABH811_01400 [archaeon]
MGCYICGKECELFEVICAKGFVNVCKNCSSDEDLPIVKKPNDFNLRESEKRPTVYERLSTASGIFKRTPENLVLKKQETTLRSLVDKNFESKIKDTRPRIDLVDNFHWIIMRIRRLKKITHEQLADKIGEPIMAIKMAEKGIVPEGYSLIRKLENYLNVKLIKDEFAPRETRPIEVVKNEFLGKPDEVFKEDNSKTLTIADLQEMKKKKERNIFEEGVEEEFVFNKEAKEDKPEFVKVENTPSNSVIGKRVVKGDSQSISQKKTNNKYNDDISKEDIDKILFGR